MLDTQLYISSATPIIYYICISARPLYFTLDCGHCCKKLHNLSFTAVPSCGVPWPRAIKSLQTFSLSSNMQVTALVTLQMRTELQTFNMQETSPVTLQMRTELQTFNMQETSPVTLQKLSNVFIPVSSTNKD